MSAPRPRLLLWDVDHTLIETRGVGRGVYARAFPQATGRELVSPAKITGSTELRILSERLDLHGIASSDELRDRYAAGLADAYRDGAELLRARGRALPGAAQALAAASARGDVQTVVTGNLRAVARTKIATFGLGDHLDLDVGAYAEDAEDRGTRRDRDRPRTAA